MTVDKVLKNPTKSMLTKSVKMNFRIAATVRTFILSVKTGGMKIDVRFVVFSWSVVFVVVKMDGYGIRSEFLSLYVLWFEIVLLCKKM